MQQNCIRVEVRQQQSADLERYASKEPENMDMIRAEPESNQQAIFGELIGLLSDSDRAVDPARDIVPKLHLLDPQILNNQTVELIAKTAFRRDPGLLIDIASGLLRAPLDSQRHYVNVIEQLDPNWLAINRASLEEILFGPIDQMDWR